MCRPLGPPQLPSRMPLAHPNPEGNAHSRVPAHALRFAFARSSGPGGQNVNKRSTKCLMWVSVGELALSPSQRARLVALAGPALLVQGEQAAKEREASELDQPSQEPALRGSGVSSGSAKPSEEPDPHASLLLLITSDENRSQERNRDACLDRLHELVLRCLVPPKQRRATKPSKASKQRRLTEKKQRGERKRNRRGEHD